MLVDAVVVYGNGESDTAGGELGYRKHVAEHRLGYMGH